VFAHQTAAPVELTSGLEATVLSLNLPAGHYLVQGKVSVVTERAVMLTCTLRDGATVLDQSAVYVEASAHGGVPLLHARSLAAPAALAVACMADDDTASVSHRALTALRVGAITTP
jgi:hypothetical protein